LDDGESYTGGFPAALGFSYYPDPELSAVAPEVRPAAGQVPLQVRGTAPLALSGPLCRVRFSREGAPGSEPPVHTKGVWNPDAECLDCLSPELPQGWYEVAVSLNGQQYAPGPVRVLYYLPPSVAAAVPNCVPAAKPSGTAEASRLSLRIGNLNTALKFRARCGNPCAPSCTQNFQF
jgi:hypothetical protein